MTRLAVLLVLVLAPAAVAAEPPAAPQGPDRSGAVNAPLAPPLGKRWVVTDLSLMGTPIIYGGRVFVTASTTSSGFGIHAFDAATGKQLWAAPGIQGEIAAANGEVFGLSGRNLVARDAATGALRWTTAVQDDPYFPSPVATDDLVLVGGDTLTGVDTHSGLILWQRTHPSGVGGNPSADGRVPTSLGAVGRPSRGC